LNCRAVTVKPIDPIAAPKILLNDFTASANDLQARVRDINTLFRSVDDRDIPAPALLPPDTRPLLKAVADVKQQIADVRFAQINFPKIAPIVVPPVDRFCV
jgi:hypothetical protein